MAIMERETSNIEPFPKRKARIQDPVTGKCQVQFRLIFCPRTSQMHFLDGVELVTPNKG